MRRANVFLKIFGYYRLCVPSDALTELLNLCMRYGFVYYALTFCDGGDAELICSRSTAKRMLAACKSYKIPIYIKGEGGAPKVLRKYRARSGIFVGILLSIVLFSLSQSVLWRIDVKGNERLSKEEVIAALEAGGLRVGGWLSEIKTDSIENRVMLNSDDISWIAINMTGTVASVEIREVIDTELKEKNASPANLIALRDAQIVALEVYSGFLCAKVGDFVREGELLVSGLYDTKQGAYRYTRASGRILAKTTHTILIEIPLEKEIKVYLEDTKEKKTLNFFGKSIKLFANSGNVGESCDIINYEYKLDPLGLGELPVSLSVEKEFPYTVELVEIDEETAIELAYLELRAAMDREIPGAQLLKKTVYGELVQDRYILKCTVVCIEDIAKLSEFEIK